MKNTRAPRSFVNVAAAKAKEVSTREASIFFSILPSPEGRKFLPCHQALPCQATCKMVSFNALQCSNPNAAAPPTLPKTLNEALTGQLPSPYHIDDVSPTWKYDLNFLRSKVTTASKYACLTASFNPNRGNSVACK